MCLSMFANETYIISVGTIRFPCVCTKKKQLPKREKTVPCFFFFFGRTFHAILHVILKKLKLGDGTLQIGKDQNLKSTIGCVCFFGIDIRYIIIY